MKLVLTHLSFSLASDAQLARPAALEDISVASVGGDIIIHGSIQNDIRYPPPTSALTLVSARGNVPTSAFPDHACFSVLIGGAARAQTATNPATLPTAASPSDAQKT